MERTHGMVERLRHILIDDVDGICQRLDADIQAAIDAYKDPWQEAATPTSPVQFSSVVDSVNIVTKVEAL